MENIALYKHSASSFMRTDRRSTSSTRKHKVILFSIGMTIMSAVLAKICYDYGYDSG